MQKIVIVTHDMYGGGCERVVTQLSNWFIKKNIECIIITEVNVPIFYDLNEKIGLYTLTENSYLSRKEIFGAYIKLRKLIKTINPDIVLSMPEKVNVWTALFLMGVKTPLVVSERNNPAIYPYSRLKRLLRKFIYPFVDGFIFQTKEACEYFPAFIQKRSIILPNPLDLQRIPKQFTERSKKEIVSVGRLETQKNFWLLIDAFADFQKEHTEYILSIYGDGSLREELEMYAKEKLLNNTYIFQGKKNDVLQRISSASMFILTSDYEGMPNALIEAMAMGLPVISTDCPIGGPRSIIKNDIDGLLIPLNNKAALINAMNQIANNKDKAQELGYNAMKIRRKLDINKVAPQWLLYIDSIVYKKNK